MFQSRVIPCLLIQNKGLVKTKKFKKPTYLGDPINIVKIFNEKEVDEIVLLDINATRLNKSPDFDYISEIVSECFMPVAYGGGIKTLNDIKKLNSIGVEKVIINSYAINNPKFILEASNVVGSQSIVVSIDVKKNIFGKYKIYSNSGSIKMKMDLYEYIKLIEKMGAGEIIINSIDNDGMMRGLDTHLIESVTSKLKIPVVACGGVGSMEDIKEGVFKGGASAVGCGSFFVFQGVRRAVLISYPGYKKLKELFKNQ